LVEEGYSDKDDMAYHDTNFHYQHHFQHEHEAQKPKQKQSRSSLFRLEEGESLIPEANEEEANKHHSWRSPNGQYSAVLSSTCELQIIRQSVDGANAIVWSSETYIPYTRAHGCHLTLSSLGRLILSVDYGSGIGTTAANRNDNNTESNRIYNTVLWSTPMPPVVPHWINDDTGNGEQPVSFRYYASLDDDGVIGVYRVMRRTPHREEQRNRSNDEYSTKTKDPTAQSNLQEDTMRTGIQSNNNLSKMQMPPILQRLGLMYHRVSKVSAKHGQTKASLVFDQLRYKVGKMARGRPRSAGGEHNKASGMTQSYANSFNEETTFNSRHECIYSTSPAGCLASGRNVIHLSRAFARTVKRSVQSVDSHLDQFLSRLTEPVSEYDDYYGYNNDGSYPPEFDDDDDEDILDTLIRVTGTAGVHLGAIGKQFGKTGMQHGKRLAGQVVGKIGQMKDKVGKQSIRMSERMAEEEVDSLLK
jgi:hypothetical protein